MTNSITTRRSSTLLTVLLTAGVLTAGLMASGSALAQQSAQDLSEQDVQDFFTASEQEMMEAVRAGDLERMVGWVRENIAEDATFLVSSEVYAGERRKGLFVLSLDKQDMLQLSQATVGLLAGTQGQPIQDYTLEMAVVQFQAIGPNAATVRTEIIESGKLVTPGGEGAAAELQTTAECSHVVQRDQAGGRLVLGLSACEAETRL